MLSNLHRAAKVAVVVCVLLFALAAPAFAQSPPPLSNPNLQLLSGSKVDAVARLPDGSIVFGGYFSRVNGTPRHNIAKLKPDGTLDTNWNPSVDNFVDVLAADSSGNVYVGGYFGNIDGQSRPYIAKLSGSGTGAVDAAWNASATNGEVYALAVDSSGDVYAGGFFSTIGGQSRSYIAKLSGSTGAADATWNPAADNGVMALAVDSSSNVYAGGYFNTIGGQSRSHIAKLSGTGTGSADATWNPSANDIVYALAMGSGGYVYAGGSFSTIGGQSRSCIAKLSGSGTGMADPTWNASANNAVFALAVDSIGDVYAGGFFSTIGGQSRSHIAKLSGSGTGAADPTWNPSADGRVSALAVSSSGDVYAGGSFQTIGGVTSPSFALLSSSGTASTAFSVQQVGNVSALAKQPNGGVIVGGHFSTANGLAHVNILRLQADGTLDTNWNPTANFGDVLALAVDSSGDVYAGGYFSNVSGLTRSNIAKLSGSGTGAVDASWNPSANSTVVALAVDSSNNVYAGGYFTNIGTQSRSYIAKLSSSGTGAADPTWNPSSDGGVDALAVDSSGNVYAGGNFYNIGTQSRNDIAKLSGSGTGAADPTWNPSADGGVYALAQDSSGNVYASGFFSNIGGQSRNYIAKLSGSGSGAADPTWNPSADGPVFALVVDSSGNFYAGGNFSNIGGQSRSNIAKLSGSGTGAADATWNPSADDVMSAVAVYGSGNVYAGGSFQTVGGQSRFGVAAISGAGDLLFSNGFGP